MTGKLRVVLMADDTVVAECADSALWTDVLARVRRIQAAMVSVPQLVAAEPAAIVTYILNEVSTEFRVPVKTIVGSASSRKPAVVNPRQIAMWLIRRHTDLSYPSIADVFHRHHTTVLAAYTRVSALVEGEPTELAARLARDIDQRVVAWRQAREAQTVRV